MICILCLQTMGFCSTAGPQHFELWMCSDCQSNYHSLYRRLYESNEDCLPSLVADSIKIYDFYIVRNFKKDTTIIFKSIVGVFEEDITFEPISFTKQVCELQFILDLNWQDVTSVIEKLNIYTNFS